ncbi:hypothetical protein VVD49_12730 [Uliginosibacterium sp. H3]|uniref:Uncharacterized protein n=1 Tax=Uliginosibacterium silvisoli TaxID=3114758 RepID=A0ABU6K4R4_9RHOO|nr:hypothetical protein [Uliginosibacterium sp. H3]
MATGPKELKQLLDQLIARKNLPFEEVLAMFAGKGGKFNQGAVMERLNFLWNKNLFVLLDATGQEVSWNDDAPYRTPADYTLRFVHIAGKEEVIAGMSADRLDLQDIQEVVPGYVWAGVQRRQELRIVGEQKTATLLAERLRAFTHQFAFHLVTRQHAQIAGLFSPHALKGQTLDTLLTRIANLEKEYGSFDYFDRVQVNQVLNGDTSAVKDSDGNVRMDIPKAIPREAIRGWSEFQMISVRTPHGLAIHEITVSLKIVEEDGYFRIADASANSTC